MDANEIISAMTREEKLRLVIGKNNWQTQSYPDINVASLTTSDGPHGLRVEIPSKKIGLKESLKATSFPSPSAMATTWNVDTVKEIGELIGEECAFNNVHVVLSPGINIKRNPLCGRNFEYFSEDPFLSGKLGGAMIGGIQKNGTGACVKHFAVNNQEERRMNVNAVVDERALHEIHLTPFEIAVKEGKPKMVMTSYNKINGVYANENERLLDLLKNDWQFSGVVTSDWGGCNDIVKSINAGSDLCMPASDYFYDKLCEGFEKGDLNEEKLNDSLKRILELQNIVTKKGRRGSNGVEYDYNLQVARKCAEESIVLLQNDGVLPLNHFDPITFIGKQVYNTVTQGGGSSRVNPLKTENIVDVMSDYELNIAGVLTEDLILSNKKHAKQNPLNPTQDEIAVMFFGHPDYYETEGRDRPTFSLPEEQISAYKSIRGLFKKVVGVVISGGIVDLSPISGCNALLFCPLGGEKSPTAIMRVLTGEVNPSGKLTETIPKSYDDVPTKEHFGDKFTSLYTESIFVGYRYYEKANVPVLFPFGHGLSYTSFEYSSAVADKKGVKFTVKNVGDSDGAEVCQVYVSKPESQVYRAVKELKGFCKVFLKVGEEKTVFIPFDDKTFRYYNTDTRSFEEEAGHYKIFVGASLDDIRLSVTLLNSGTAKIKQRSDIQNYFLGNVKAVNKEEFERLLGYNVQEENYDFYKKNRVKINLNHTIADLVYAKGFVARLIGKIIARKLKKIDKLPPKKGGDLSMTVNVPLRVAVVFAGFNLKQAEGLLLICNGNFFKGLSAILKGRKNK